MAEEKASSLERNADGGTSSSVAAAPPSSAAAEEPLPADRAAGPTEKGRTEEAAPSPAGADGRSFSQLLAGAMASPAASPRPSSIVTVPVVALPCFMTPASLVDSQGLTGQFAMTHQAVLATVTAQAQLQLQAACPSSSSNVISSVCPIPLRQMPLPTPKKIPGDVYNWRKYGQKPVKSSENARSYYRCTDPNCSAKKKVEHCPDGTVVEVIYRGKHNHDPPQKHRYTRDRGAQSCGASLENENLERPNTEAEKSDNSVCKPEQNSSNETSKQQLFCSSDCEFDVGTKSEEDIADEPDPKRRHSENSKISSVPILKTVKEYIVQTEIDARHLSDGYRWRKYGQKIVKGNSNPRSYYRCTHSGCPVRKHVERVPHDAKALLITYEGEHNHHQPTSKFACVERVPHDAKALLLTYEGEHNHHQPTAKFACDSPLTALKSNAAAGVADEQLSTLSDSAVTALKSNAAASVADEQVSKSPSSIKKPSGDLHKSTAVEEVSGDGNLELGGDRALESAQALLSMGFSSTPTGEKNARNTSEGMKSPILTESPAAVSVQNT